jgi:DNA polymerase III epsilon subunit-like protein
MIRRLFLLDVETTGLDPCTGHVVELGCAIYDVEHACVVDAFSALIRAPSNEAERTNHIPPALLVDARDPGPVWKSAVAMAARCELATAYNASFDRQWLPPELDGARPWVCSHEDMDWPFGRGGKLVALAADHGVAVANAHRALGDVLLMAALFTRVDELHRLGRAPHSLSQLFDRALSPRVTVVGQQPMSQNDAAKGAGFVWNTAVRRWTRRVLAEEAEAFVAGLSFPAIVERSA